MPSIRSLAVVALATTLLTAVSSVVASATTARDRIEGIGISLGARRGIRLREG